MSILGLVRRPDLFFCSQTFIFLLWLFLLVFPKGGIKVGEIPITWGYLLLGLGCFYAFLQQSWQIAKPRIEALLLLFPFQMISMITMIVNGVELIGWTISFFVSFFFLPWCFLFLFAKSIEELDLDYWLLWLRRGISFLAYYGLFLFVYKFVVGRFLEIPLLTVNWGDLGMLDDHKCNSRGMISKLISTYNNGQLFGISMTMLLPLYCYLQKNHWHRWAFKLALFLTLSRTTWIGLIVNEICFALFIDKKNQSLVFKLLLSLTAIACAFAAVAFYTGWGTDFLFDANLGGRRAQLEALQTCSWVSEKPFIGFPEMVYVGVLDSFGIIGFIAYLLALGGPILFYLFRSLSSLHKCIALGLANYLFISISDGAVLYIPIMAFFWLLLSLLARGALVIKPRSPCVEKDCMLF